MHIHQVLADCRHVLIDTKAVKNMQNFIQSNSFKEQYQIKMITSLSIAIGSLYVQNIDNYLINNTLPKELLVTTSVKSRTIANNIIKYVKVIILTW